MKHELSDVEQSNTDGNDGSNSPANDSRVTSSSESDVDPALIVPSPPTPSPPPPSPVPVSGPRRPLDDSVLQLLTSERQRRRRHNCPLVDFLDALDVSELVSEFIQLVNSGSVDKTLKTYRFVLIMEVTLLG